MRLAQVIAEQLLVCSQVFYDPIQKDADAQKIRMQAFREALGGVAVDGIAYAFVEYRKRHQHFPTPGQIRILALQHLERESNLRRFERAEQKALAAPPPPSPEEQDAARQRRVEFAERAMANAGFTDRLTELVKKFPSASSRAELDQKAKNVKPPVASLDGLPDGYRQKFEAMRLKGFV